MRGISARHDAFGCLPMVALAVMVAMGLFFIGSLIRPAKAIPVIVDLTCGPYEGFKKRLWNIYREKSGGKGLAGKKAVNEVFTASSGTYTILQIDAKNNACIIGAGQGWQWTPVDSGTSL